MAYYDEADWVDTLLPEDEKTRPEDAYYAPTPDASGYATTGDVPEEPDPRNPTDPGPVGPQPNAGAYPVPKAITQQFLEALYQPQFYPGYKILNGQLVWQGTGQAPSPEMMQSVADSLTDYGTPLSKGDYRAFFERLMGHRPATSDTLGNADLGKILTAAGLKVFINPNNPSKIHKIVTPQGSYVDVIDSNGKWQWLDQGAPGSGSGAGGGAGLGAGAPAFSYPYFEPPGFEAPPFNAPQAFDYPDFEPPDPSTFSDPGYEFSRKEGLRARTNAASAEGLSRSGGFLKGLEEYAQGLAAQQYGNVYGRKQNEWMMGRGAAADEYDRNYQNSLTDWMRQYNAEADEFNRANLTYGTNFNTAATGAGINLNAGNARWNQLLGLYDLSTRSLPKYPGASAPTVPSYGY